MKMTDAEMDALVEQIIDRAGRESSADGMDGDRWDRILVRAALTARLAADQQKGGGDRVRQAAEHLVAIGNREPQGEFDRRWNRLREALFASPQPSIPAPAQQDARPPHADQEPQG